MSRSINKRASESNDSESDFTNPLLVQNMSSLKDRFKETTYSKNRNISLRTNEIINSLHTPTDLASMTPLLKQRSFSARIKGGLKAANRKCISLVKQHMNERILEHEKSAIGSRLTTLSPKQILIKRILEKTDSTPKKIHSKKYVNFHTCKNGFYLKKPRVRERVGISKPADFSSLFTKLMSLRREEKCDLFLVRSFQSARSKITKSNQQISSFDGDKHNRV